METIQVIMPGATFDHIRVAVPGWVDEPPMISVTLEKAHAVALRDALAAALEAK